MPVNLPDDFFLPPPERGDDWPDDPELRRGVEWLRGFLDPADWKKRRMAAANRLYETALNRIDPDDPGRFFAESDIFG